MIKKIFLAGTITIALGLALSLPVKAAATAADECPICLDDINDTSQHGPKTWLPCGHALHQTCYNQVMSGKQKNCPLCGLDIVRADAEAKAHQEEADREMAQRLQDESHQERAHAPARAPSPAHAPARIPGELATKEDEAQIIRTRARDLRVGDIIIYADSELKKHYGVIVGSIPGDEYAFQVRTGPEKIEAIGTPFFLGKLPPEAHAPARAPAPAAPRRFNTQVAVDDLFNGRKFLVHTSRTATIRELKQSIFEQQGIPVDQQKIVLMGNLLSNDDLTIEHCGMDAATNIHLLRNEPAPARAPLPGRAPAPDRTIGNIASAEDVESARRNPAKEYRNGDIVIWNDGGVLRYARFLRVSDFGLVFVDRAPDKTNRTISRDTIIGKLR